MRSHCVSRRIFLLVIVVSCLVGGPVRAERLYAAFNLPDGEDSIVSVNLDGTDFQTVLPLSLTQLDSIVADPATNRFYWAALDIATFFHPIRRVGPGGCFTVHPGPHFTKGIIGAIALDAPRGKVYWTINSHSGAPPEAGIGAGVLRRSNVDGSDSETLHIGERLANVEVDSAAGKVYWISLAGTGTIYRSDLDGSNVEDVVTVPAFDIFLDTENDKLYWTTGQPSFLWRANLDGSAAEKLFELPSRSPFVVDPEGQQVFWLEGNSISRVNLDGSDPGVLVAGPPVGAPGVDLVLVDGNVGPHTCRVPDVPAIGWSGSAILALVVLSLGTGILRRRKR